MKYEFKGTHLSWRASEREEGNEWPWAIEGFRDNESWVLPVADVCDNPNNKEIIEANAHLISAAPDLLQAAIDTLQHFEQIEPLYSGDKAILNTLKTAIHKALNIEG